ncbi:MAG: Crp/Fnr family transcriptional regulator [Anaerolineaceae bacterium]|nr:Crp/Fnr family transcriptional regulator [Anaerolineaceae bacterium]
MNASDLNQIPLFAELTPVCRQELSRILIHRDIAAGESLVLEGDPSEACYFVRSGAFRVLRMNRDGKIQVLSRLSAGEPINIISLLMPERTNRASVEALTPASVLILTAKDFDTLLVSCPEFSVTLLRHFAQRIRHMTDLAADLSLLSVRSRLARFLISLADEPDTPCDWTQDEIAAQIGTVRDVVGRTLRDFETLGLISRDHQRITLLDRSGLMREAALE